MKGVCVYMCVWGGVEESADGQCGRCRAPAGSKVYDLKLFPEDPVELMVGEALVLNCTAMVEFNAGVDLQWQYPRQQVQGMGGEG